MKLETWYVPILQHIVIFDNYLLKMFLVVMLVITHIGFEGRTLVLIVSVPGHYLPFHFLDIGVRIGEETKLNTVIFQVHFKETTPSKY